MNPNPPDRARRPGAWSAVALAGVLAGTLAAAAPAGAQAPAPEVGVEVVADGLNVPRGLAYDPLLRRVVVAEAGNATGNDGACAVGHGINYCYGETGSVFQYSETRWLPTRRISTGLPSTFAPDVAGTYDVILGLADVTLPFGTGPVVGVVGMHADPAFRDALAAEHPGAGDLATATWVLPGEGNLETIVDFLDFEVANNPDDGIIDSNLFAVLGEGPHLTIADAAGNYVAETNLLGHPVEVATVLPQRFLEGDPLPFEPVATSLARGEDGSLYIGELSGAFAPVGFARVWRITPDGERELFADGFTNIVDLEVDSEGRLVVLELARSGFYQNPQPDGDRTGQLIRIEHDGTRTLLLDEPLENPGGVVEARPGVFYVTNRSAHLGGDGELLRVTVDD